MSTDGLDRIVELLFEAGMLKRTPRTGWPFLGPGTPESVADHSYRATVIAFVLARMDGTVDADRTVRLALFHDLPEARTGDLNYLNQKYVTADEEAAASAMTDGLPFANELRELLAEFRAQETREAKLARDADHLELILELRQRLDEGNPNAADWLRFALQRLGTDIGRELAARIAEADSTSWWFDQRSRWWVDGGKK
jgi:putative hydrolase of HD superfamily